MIRCSFGTSHCLNEWWPLHLVFNHRQADTVVRFSQASKRTVIVYGSKRVWLSTVIVNRGPMSVFYLQSLFMWMEGGQPMRDVERQDVASSLIRWNCPIWVKLKARKYALISRQCLFSRDPCYLHGLKLFPAWISNHTSKMLGEITYLFPNSIGCTKFYNCYKFLSLLDLKLIHVSEKDPQAAKLLWNGSIDKFPGALFAIIRPIAIGI